MANIMPAGAVCGRRATVVAGRPRRGREWRTVDPIDLLIRLVQTKSYSGEEGAAADALERALRDAGADVRRVEHNVIAEKGRGPRTLLFNSHLDTVPASTGWTRDPWKAEIIGDQLFGLGSTDAKSCVAAMAAAFVAADPGPRGRLIFTATVEEETGGGGEPNGMETVLPPLGRVDAGIVGEPTALNICNGQRGMVRIVLHATGRSGHASRPWEGVNAIEIAAADVLVLRALAAEIAERGDDPVVGKPTIQATIVAGGTAANVIPDRCDVTLDLRTTRSCDNDALIADVQRLAKSAVEVRSRRFIPVATEPEAQIVRAARVALPDAQVRPFGGVSDMYFLAKSPGGAIPAVLIGPGDGRQSHQPDEFVSVTMVRRGADAYRAIASQYLAE